MSDNLITRLRESADWLDGVGEGRDDARIVSRLYEAAARISSLERALAERENQVGILSEGFRRRGHNWSLAANAVEEALHWIDTGEFDDGSETNCPVSAIAPRELVARLRAFLSTNESGAEST